MKTIIAAIAAAMISATAILGLTGASSDRPALKMVTLAPAKTAVNDKSPTAQSPDNQRIACKLLLRTIHRSDYPDDCVRFQRIATGVVTVDNSAINKAIGAREEADHDPIVGCGIEAILHYFLNMGQAADHFAKEQIGVACLMLGTNANEAMARRALKSAEADY